MERLTEACRALPRARQSYPVDDFVTNLPLAVVDFQMHTTAVVRATEHYKAHRWGEVRTMEDLERLFERWPDDQPGNLAVAHGATSRWPPPRGWAERRRLPRQPARAREGEPAARQGKPKERASGVHGVRVPLRPRAPWHRGAASAGSRRGDRTTGRSRERVPAWCEPSPRPRESLALGTGH